MLPHRGVSSKKLNESKFDRSLSRIPGVRPGKTRDEVIYSAYYKYDFTQKTIAEYLGLHYTTIILAIKRYEEGRKIRCEPTII